MWVDKISCGPVQYEKSIRFCCYIFDASAGLPVFLFVLGKFLLLIVVSSEMDNVDDTY